jgi:hypothetical protein
MSLDVWHILLSGSMSKTFPVSMETVATHLRTKTLSFANCHHTTPSNQQLHLMSFALCHEFLWHHLLLFSHTQSLHFQVELCCVRNREGSWWWWHVQQPTESFSSSTSATDKSHCINHLSVSFIAVLFYFEVYNLFSPFTRRTPQIIKDRITTFHPVVIILKKFKAKFLTIWTR